MVRETCDGIIGDAPVGEIVYSSRLPPTMGLHGYGGGSDAQRQEQHESAGVVPAESERGGYRHGRHRPFRRGALRPHGTAGAGV